MCYRLSLSDLFTSKIYKKFFNSSRYMSRHCLYQTLISLYFTIQLNYFFRFFLGYNTGLHFGKLDTFFGHYNSIRIHKSGVLDKRNKLHPTNWAFPRVFHSYLRMHCAGPDSLFVFIRCYFLFGIFFMRPVKNNPAK